MGGGGDGQQQNAISEAQLARGAGILEDVKTPSAAQLTARLQRAVYLGDISAIEAEIFLQKESAMRGIEIDPALEEAQFAALESLGKMGAASGLTAGDKAALFESGEQEQAVQRQNRRAIESGASARGIGSSGFEQAAQAEALQEPLSAGLTERLEVARGAGARRLGAQAEAGSFAGELRTQGFNEDARAAAAQDVINRFNTEATNTGRLFNVEDARAVALRNAQERQRLSDLNTEIANKEEMGRAQASQQAFDNRLAKTTALSNLYTQGGLAGAQSAGATPAPGSLGLAAAGAGAQLLGEYAAPAWDYWKKKRPANTFEGQGPLLSYGN